MAFKAVHSIISSLYCVLHTSFLLTVSTRPSLHYIFILLLFRFLNSAGGGLAWNTAFVLPFRSTYFSVVVNKIMAFQGATRLFVVLALQWLIYYSLQKGSRLFNSFGTVYGGITWSESAQTSRSAYLWKMDIAVCSILTQPWNSAGDSVASLQLVPRDSPRTATGIYLFS